MQPSEIEKLEQESQEFATIYKALTDAVAMPIHADMPVMWDALTYAIMKYAHASFNKGQVQQYLKDKKNAI